MSSTVGSLDTAVGEVRFASEGAWLHVRFEVAAESLVLRPLAPNADEARVWAFSEIQAIEEIQSTQHEQVIEVIFDNGARATLKLPRDFISAMLDRLAASPPAPEGSLAISAVTPDRPPISSQSIAAATSLSPTTLEPVIDLTESTVPSPIVQAPIDAVLPPPLPAWSPPATTTAAAQMRPATFTIRPKRSRRSVLIGVVAVVAIATLAVSTFVFRSDATKYEDLATSRGEQLTETKASLDKATTALSEVTTERDSLKQRVTEVTNEKAQVQDERNASQEVARLGGLAAQQMLDCRDRLLTAMRSLVSGFDVTTSVLLDRAVPVCQAANSAVSAFSDALG